MRSTLVALTTALAFATQALAADYSLYFWSDTNCGSGRQAFSGGDTTGCNTISNAQSLEGELQDGTSPTTTDYVACAYTNSDCTGAATGLDTSAGSGGCTNIYSNGNFLPIQSWIVKRGSC